MFSNPEKNIAKLPIREGMSVADFGAGSGFYTKLLSSQVGITGHVYAIEIQKDLVKRIEGEVKELGLTNVNVIWGNIEKKGGTKIADKSVDFVILSNVLFQVDDILGLLDEAKRILKSQGQIAIIDWHDSFNGMGPDHKRVIKEDQIVELCIKRGLKKVENISISDHHYGIILSNE